MDQHQTDKIALLERRVADLEDHLARETRSSQAANARAEDYEREIADARKRLAAALDMGADGYALAYLVGEVAVALHPPDRSPVEVDDAEPDFPVDERGFVTFWADGENAPCEELELRLEGDDFTLREGGDLHDGHSTLEDVAEAFPEVSDSLAAWKAGRRWPFEAVLKACREACGASA